MPSQSGSHPRLQRYQQLRREIDSEPDPAQRRERILSLLAPSASWVEVRLGVEALVDHVGVPSNDERAALRGVVERCDVGDGADRSTVVRTAALRMLSREPEPEDLDLLLAATRTFLVLDGVDVSAELRGLGLLGLSRLDADLARWPAAERLFDEDVPNQEPHRTAVRLLAGAGDLVMLRYWLDHGPINAQPVEAVCDAEGALAQAMPAGEWGRRAERRLGDERPMETLAAVETATMAPRPELRFAIRDLLLGITDEDLFRAMALALAAARHPAFTEQLLGLVEDVSTPLLGAYEEAVSLSRGAGREAALAAITARVRAGTGTNPMP